METGRWRINSFSGGAAGDDHHSNFTNSAWDIWDNSITAPHDWINPASVREQQPEASVVHALLFNNSTRFPDAGVVGWNSEPHMMCLKLGKRHYCDDAGSSTTTSSTTKRAGSNSNPCYVTDRWRVTANSTRCQVEGCHVALVNAKEYYRRHKVCEIHSKAPKVVVSGLQQRFCQQCSRFHDVREFDEAKRSCRRRLEGHNLRRRKGALSNSLPRNFPHSQENTSTMERRLGELSKSQSSSSQSRPVCALSLLSSPKTEPWISSGDLSSRCSAALYELIAANRASSVSGHFLNQNSSHQPTSDNTMHTSQDTNGFNDHTTMTLDEKRAPALDFGLLAMKEESKDPEEWTDYCWSVFGGANVV